MGGQHALGLWLRAAIANTGAVHNAVKCVLLQKGGRDPCHTWLREFARWLDSDQELTEEECGLGGSQIVVWSTNGQQRAEMREEDVRIDAYCWAAWKLHCWLFRQQVNRRPRSAGRMTVGFDGQRRARRAHRRRRCGVQCRDRVRPSVVPRGWVRWSVYYGERVRQPYGLGTCAIEWRAAMMGPQHGWLTSVDRRMGGDVVWYKGVVWQPEMLVLEDAQRAICESSEDEEPEWHAEWVLAASVPVESDWRSVEFSGLATFTVTQGSEGAVWDQITTAVDSMAMVNCVLAAVVQAHWIFVSTDECMVKGMGGAGVHGHSGQGGDSMPCYGVSGKTARVGVLCGVRDAARHPVAGGPAYDTL